MKKLLSTLLLLMVTTSCENINLDTDLQGDSGGVEINTVPLVTDANASNYSLSGSCANNIDKVHITVNGNNNIVDCVAKNWSVTLNMTSELNGVISLVISSEKNSIINIEETTSTVKNSDSAPTTSNFTATSFDEDSSSTITLSYSDVDNDQASSCNVSGAGSLGLSTCTCSSGTCSVTLNPSTNYFGSSSFSYTVTANGKVSNSSAVSVAVNAVNDVPTITATSCAKTLKVGTVFSCTPTAFKDIGSETILWSLGASNTCSFASINSSTGAISGTPSSGSEGACSLEIVAHDGSLQHTEQEEVYIQYNIVEVASLTGNINDTDIKGSYAYLVKTTNTGYSTSAGLIEVLDISDPTNPTVSSSAVIDGNNRPYDVYVSGNYAYVNASRSFFIFDISNPNAVTRVYKAAQSQYLSNFAGITTYGTNLFVSRAGGVEIYDITAPATPVFDKQVGVGGFGVAVEGQYLYGGAGYVGGRAYDFTDMLAGIVTYNQASPGSYTKATNGESGVIFVGSGNYNAAGTLRSYNLAQNPLTSVLSSLSLGNAIDNITTFGTDELFITGRGWASGINIVDKSDTNNLRLKGQSPSTACSGSYMAMGDMSGDTMILTCGTGGAKIYIK